jgi:hypothetical protein
MWSAASQTPDITPYESVSGCLFFDFAPHSLIGWSLQREENEKDRIYGGGAVVMSEGTVYTTSIGPSGTERISVRMGYF